jgi:hypothetical protein
MIRKGVLSTILFFVSPILFAQFSGHNLLEYQYGKLPSDTVDSFSTIYDRLVIDYSFKGFRGGITLEQFFTPYNERNYIRINQARLQYYSKSFEVKLGNFYETIGRGLLLRSYEIPGAILEDMSYRSRHYFNRDVTGVNIKYRKKNFSVKLISGWPLNNVFPPNQGLENRRSDRIDALYADYLIKRQSIGASIMNLTNSGGSSQYAMVTLSGTIWPFLTYYTEIAKNINDFSPTDFSMESEYAFYFNANVIFADFGITAEYKFYNQFVLGAGINEPPALVKEHTYKLLNRSTHVPQPQNETGYQFELYYNLEIRLDRVF